MAATATAANNSKSPAESVPPPCRSANATTNAAPPTDAIQNRGRGRSWVMATATSAVAIGIIPNTTPPCEASTVCTPSAIRNGNRKQTQSIVITSCGHSVRGGSGRRNTSNSASEHSPAMTVRNDVSAIGSISDTAMRVAGSVPPKIAMPTKPSNRPRRSRDTEGDMVRVVSSFACTRTVFCARRMAAMRGNTIWSVQSDQSASLLMANAAPQQSDPGQNQKPEYDVAKVSIAERVIGPRAEPRADQRSWKRKQHEPDHVRLDEAGCDLHAERGCEYRPVKGLENAAPLLLAPAAHAGPQDGNRTRESRETAKDAAGEADGGVGPFAAEAERHRRTLENHRGRKHQQQHADGQFGNFGAA